MYSKLLSWSRGLYLAGIVLALVLVIPTAWFPFQLAKLGVFSLFLLVAVVLWVLAGGARDLLRSHGLYGALLIALIPIAYLISTAFSIDSSVAYAGFGVETDTVVFTAILFVVFVLSFSFFKTMRTVRLLMMVVFWALVAAAVFQCISILFGQNVIPFSTFADRSVNLVGKWNDLGILVGLLVLMLISRVELIYTSPLWRLVTGAILVVLAILLGLINFPIVWGMVLGGCIILAIVRFLIQRADPTEAPQTWISRMPWYAVTGAAVALIFLFFGSTFNTGLTSIFPVSSLEVRPSYSSTLDIVSAARQGSFTRVLVGTGPNTFGEEWIMHKPAEVNQSAFWSLDFNVGFSTLMTALGTVGIIGFFAWLIPLILVLAGLVRVVRLGVLNREDKIVATTLGVSSLFLLASIILYVPSQNILILSFVLAGAAFGFLWRQGQSSVEGENTRMPVAALALMLVLVVITLWSTFKINQRMIAEAFVGHGAAALTSGDVDTALKDATRAQGFEKTGDVLRLMQQADLSKLQQVASSKDATTQAVQKQFATVTQSAIAAGQSAQTLNPQDYRPTFALAQLYDYLSTLNVQGAAATAVDTYKNAAKKNPTNPTIPLALARLEAGLGNVQLTTNYLSQSLTLKPNYTDAILLVVQLNVANKDIPNAIRAATAAAQTAPGVAPIWFELGLLYYSSGDYANATKALEQAVSIVPNYANAQYFLGLSYYQLERNADAITQFQALAKSNPDNTEVTLILSNLQAGKKPFDNQTPPEPPPLKRSTAPISQ